MLSRVASGDAAAFEAIYDAHSGVMYGLLLRMLRTEQDAQEVLQDAMLQIWNRAKHYDPARGSEPAWIISITRSRALDRLRSRKTRSTREDEASRDRAIVIGDTEDATGVDYAMERERMRAVRSALTELPEAQRTAVELAFFEGLTHTEIAAQLNQPLGTIKTRIQLGMRKLRERLSTFGD